MINIITTALFCLLVVGCGSTSVFMGDYDSVEIVVSDNQATMTAENLPCEAQLEKGRLGKKVIGNHVFESQGNNPADNSCPALNSFKGKLHVNIICSDETVEKKFSDDFYKETGIGLYKPDRGAEIISEVTIYPKMKGAHDLEDYYHLIKFVTRGELIGGTHRVLVKDPLAFKFLSANTTTVDKIKLVIAHSGNIEDEQFVVNDSKVAAPVNLELRVLSETISTTKKPIKIIFTTAQPIDHL